MCSARINNKVTAPSNAIVVIPRSSVEYPMVKEGIAQKAIRSMPRSGDGVRHQRRRTVFINSWYGIIKDSLSIHAPFSTAAFGLGQSTMMTGRPLPPSTFPASAGIAKAGGDPVYGDKEGSAQQWVIFSHPPS